MSIKIPTLSEVTMLEMILSQQMTLRLYTNDVTPADEHTAASFTEMTGLNYAAKTLLPDHWDFVSGEEAQAVYQALQQYIFTQGIPIKVYGYVVTRNLDDKLMWAERFIPAGTTPIDYFVVGNANGDKIEFYPSFSFRGRN